MKNEAHPEAILRSAWNTHRLDAIRAIVRETISELNAAEPSTQETHVGDDPASEALFACCNELREACGLAVVERAGGLGGPSTEARHAQWRASYEAALERYRLIAGAALRTALSQVEAGPLSKSEPSA